MHQYLDSNSESSSFTSSSFPSFYVEALVPINPGRWPVFTAAIGSEMIEVSDKITTPMKLIT